MLYNTVHKNNALLFIQDLKKDAESIAVHAGCTLEIFTDEDCDNSKSFIFTAKPNKPLFIRRIEKAEDSDYDGEGLQVVDTDDLDDFREYLISRF